MSLLTAAIPSYGKSVEKHGAGGTIIVSNSDHLVHPHGIRKIISVTPETGGTAFGQNVKFRMSKNLIGDVKSCYLEFQLSETGGIAVAGLTCVPLFIQRLELSVNGNNTAIQTLYGEDFYRYLSFLPSDELSHMEAQLNLNATDGTFVPLANIAAGATNIYRLPLYQLMLNSFNLSTIDSGGDIGISIDLVASPKLSGTGVVSLDSVCLKLETFCHREAESKLQSLATRVPTLHSYTKTQNHTSSMTLTAGQTHYIQLKGLAHTVNTYLLVISIRASNALADLLTCEDMSLCSFDIQTPGKSTLIGSSRTGEALTWELIQDHPSSNTMFRAIGYVPIILGQGIGRAIGGNSSAGGIKLTGDEYLELTLDSTFTTASYFVNIHSYQQAAYVESVQGKFSNAF